MWQSGRMKKLRRLLAGWLCVILVVSLNISSLAEKGGLIGDIISGYSSEGVGATNISSNGTELTGTESAGTETSGIESAQEKGPEKSSVISHTPSNPEKTEKPDMESDPEEEATPSDADEELINDLIDDATPSDATPGDADLLWSVEDLQKRIDALPEVRELEGEELGDYLLEVYREVVDIREAVESLSEDEQALLDVGKLEELERFFVEEYPAVFAAESGVLVDTGLVDSGRLRYSVYTISEADAANKEYSVVYTWEGDNRSASLYFGNAFLTQYRANIKKLIFPEDGSIVLSNNVICGWSGIREIEFPDSIITMERNVISKAPGNRVSDKLYKITLPGSIEIRNDAIEQSAVPRLSQLIFTSGNPEKRGRIGANVFENSYIGELAFPDALKEIGDSAFSGSKFLKELDLGKVEVLGANVFAGCSSLKRVEIPATVTSIGSKAFSGCEIERLVYRAASDMGVAEDAIEMPEQSTLVIGQETKTLTGPLLNGLNHVTILFEPENTINITGITDAPADALENLDGTYYVDAAGVLYTEDKSSLIYCPPGITSYTVPGTVTSVGKYAFSQAKDLTEITFAAPENVTSFGTRAFYGSSKLAQINGQTSVTEVKNSFPNCTVWDSQLFMNTALTDAPRTGGVLQKEMIELRENGDDAILSFGFSKGETTVENDTGFENLTGDIIHLQVNAQGTNASTYQYRIYMETSDASCSLGMQVNQTLQMGQAGKTIPVTLRESDAEGIYYLEFSLDTGSTVFFEITPAFPSPGSAGGTVTIWGAILTDEEKDKIGNGLTQDGDAAQRAEWKTVRNSFLVEKTAAGDSLANGLALLGDGTETGNLHVTVNGGDAAIAYDLKLKLDTGSGTQDTPYGKDYVRTIQCRDSLVLPPGMHWQQELLDAIQAEDWYTEVSGKNNEVLHYYVKIAGETRQFAQITCSPGIPYQDTASHRLSLSDGSVILSWDLLNTSADVQEISDKTVSLSINSEFLLVGQGDMEYGWTSEQTLTNHIGYTIHYTYSGETVIEDSADLPVAPAKSDFTMEKKIENRYYKKRGEDNYFTITLANKGGLSYSCTNASLEDTELPKDYYIRPENIAKMFMDAQFGKCMKLTITEASLYTELAQGKATGIDGKTEVPVTAATSAQGELKSSNAALVFAWEKDVLGLSVYSGGNTDAVRDEYYPIELTEDGSSVQNALNQAGYLVTYEADYNIVWDLKDITLYSGQSLEMIVYTTAKNTFQFIQKPYQQKAHINSGMCGANTAKLIYQEAGQNLYKTATDKGYADYEFYIKKGATINGSTVPSDSVVAMGEKIDYSVDFRHYGEDEVNNLPVIDYLAGPQQLLVPADANRDAGWAAGLVPETIDEVEYYILTPEQGNAGEYRNVWVGADENGNLLCADSVKLERAEGQLKTTITWYYHNLSAGNYIHTVNYTVRLKATGEDRPTDSCYKLRNEVWLNGRPNDYLYDYISLYAFDYSFNKEIVLSPEGSPEVTKVHSSIKKGDKVRYKLSLDLYDNTTQEAEVTTAYDVLPDTYEKFAWTKDNVKIYYTDGTGAPVADDFKWEIIKTQQSGQVSSWESSNRYYTIQWEKLTIPLTNLYIYVELQFPEDAGVWDAYDAVNDGRLLYNDFYISGIQRRVSHELVQPGRVYLQKGVFRIGGYLDEKNGYDGYFGTNTRTHYINDDGTHPSIVYFIQLYNGGNSRLYLTEIQDLLPKGVVLADDRNTYGYIFGDSRTLQRGENSKKNYVTTDDYSVRNGSVDPYTSAFSGFSDNNIGTIRYLGCKVTVQKQEDASTDRQKLKFTFESPGGFDTVKYDSERNLSYLDKGQAIAFAYVCNTGTEKETEDYAENVVAMPYLDYSGGGVDVAEGVTGDTYNFLADSNGTMTELLGENKGICDLMSNDEALQEGFSIPDADQQQKWLRSAVTAERGGIVPGITCKASTYTNEDSGVELPYSNGAGPNDIINWTVSLSNNGEAPIVDYIVKDTMEYPYTFTGDVTLSSYTMTGLERYTTKLFSITARETDPDTGQQQLMVKYTESYGSEKIIAIPLAESEGAAEWKDLTVRPYNGICTYQLRFYKDGAREVMEIHLKDREFQVLTGGNVKLQVSTKNETENRPYKIYSNYTVLKPVQPYEENRVTQGMNVTDEIGKNAGVRNSAQVVIAGAYATSSLNAVEEADMPSGEINKTDTSGLINYILLPDKQKEFIYTLTVNNDNTHEYSVADMTFIDNLPEIGDHATFSEENDRGSQFKVSFAQNPNVKVNIEYEDGSMVQLDPATQYVVEYTNKTEFEEADWDGAGTGWLTTQEQDARSLRVRILPTQNKDFIPKLAKVHVSFHARIDGNAESGSIAWNSFGYRYSMIDETPRLLSAPMKIGVKIPEVPILEKRLLSATNEAFTARNDQTFRFLIHQGAVLDGLDYNDEDAVKTVFSEPGAPAFTVASVTVKSGDTSGQTVLTGLKQWKTQSQPDGTIEWMEDVASDWNWTDKTQYTIAELTPGDEYQFYRLYGGTVNGVSFYHQDDKSIRLDCENRYPGWSLLLKKVDSKIETTLLSGAIFALYSPLLSDQIAEDDSAYQALGESERPDMTYVEPGNDGAAEITWYLADIRTTGESGTIIWEGLSEDSYRLKEVRAPEGYQMSDTGYLAAVKPERQEGNTNPPVLTVSVKNASAFVLPKTGGTGTLPINLAGILCLCYSGFLYKKKRAGKFTQKGKGGNEK